MRKSPRGEKESGKEMRRETYQRKGVRVNGRHFMNTSKKKITTAAVGPFIS